MIWSRRRLSDDLFAPITRPTVHYLTSTARLSLNSWIRRSPSERL